MALPTWYSAGLVSVESGSTTVTVTGAYWGTGGDDDNIMVGDRFIVPGQPLIPAVPIAAVNGDEIELLWPWPGVDVAGQSYVIEYVGIIERSTRANRMALERMADISAWFDQIVADDTSRLALETPSNPLVANRRILVREDGVIWAKKTSAYGDWEGPVAFRGDIGQKGWSPVPGIVADGARRVWQLVDWVGGQGVKPAGVGKYVGAAGLVDDIADAVNVRGPAGDLSGVTTFWQGRITVDADAGAALTGLGFSTFVKTLVDDADAGAFLTSLGFSSFIKTLIDDANAAAARATLGLEYGFPLIHVVDEKPYATDGGSAVSGANGRTLNTVRTNGISGASLATNYVTLPAGTYWVEGEACFAGVDRNLLLLVNVTSGAGLMTGTAGLGTGLATICGLLTLTEPTTIQLRHYVQTASATVGLGAGNTVGFSNTFAQLKFWKLK